ncbi:hypothetical protein HHK36_023726 [Tetracentron sinense]|uniref:F-box domain-containing protein n=1 Tax=Tetracentron sinense TaxID=13715 RepID=A0A834YQR6_TETSI|nr:hypothetical protein HHK36_023726 [Tetracentron sinense]
MHAMCMAVDVISLKFNTTDFRGVIRPLFSCILEESNNMTELDSLKKQKTCEKEQDRISSLPDSVLIHILSFLPTKDAIKTILLRRFGYLWTYLPTLDFDDSVYREFMETDVYFDSKSDGQFVKFVNHTLILHKDSTISKFRLRFQFFDYPDLLENHPGLMKKKRLADEINTWIRFAIRKNVHVLDLDFLADKDFADKPDIDTLYELPHYVFCNDSVTELKLTFCDIKPWGHIQMGSLKTLSLKCIPLFDNIIADILSGCPLLEELVLIECFDLDKLSITSPHLKKVTVYSGIEHKIWLDELTISCPNLMSLDLSGRIMQANLTDKSALVSVNLDFNFKQDDDYDEEGEENYSNFFFLHDAYPSLKRLLERLHSTKVLTKWELEKTNYPCLSSNWKYVEVQTMLTKWHLPGVASLLRRSANLETLTIHIDPGTDDKVDKTWLSLDDFDGADYWNSQELSFPCLTHHLKTVTMSGFNPKSYEMQLVEFLLKNAKVLEKMVISTKWRKAKDYRLQRCFTWEEKLEFTQKLLEIMRKDCGADLLTAFMLDCLKSIEMRNFQRCKNEMNATIMEERRDSSSSPKRQKTCSQSSIDSSDQTSQTSIQYSSDQNSETSIQYSSDQISQLPDIVLLHILSFLPMKDAVKMGILSKRWEYLWTSVPKLDYHTPEFLDEDVDDFVTFVNRTLVLYEGPKIQKIHVCFNCKEWHVSSVDLWIRLAIRKNVEELDLDFAGKENVETLDGYLYLLPQYMYTKASLTKLRLSFCLVRPRGLICWRLLKNLSLAYVELSDNLIQKMLSGSPSLEVLDLCECTGLKHLDFTSTRLKKLTIRDYFDSENSDDVLKISAPNLQSLGIFGFLPRSILLLNLSSLTEATLNFELINHNGVKSSVPEGYQNIMWVFLEKLHHVMDLTIGSCCIQVLSIMELKIWPPVFSKCKCLTLETCLNKRELPGIARLLKCSPDLETLVVKRTSPSSIQFHNEDYWKLQKPFSECRLHHLRTVKIFDFKIGNSIMEFVEFLLKNAIVLEKMIIYCSIAYLNWRIRPNEALEFARKLLSFPRASPHATMLNLENMRKDCEAELLPNFTLDCLKSVEMQNFQGCKNEIELLKFLLKNALVLEKMIITPTDWLSSEKKRLSKFSRTY